MDLVEYLERKTQSRKTSTHKAKEVDGVNEGEGRVGIAKARAKLKPNIANP